MPKQNHFSGATLGEAVRNATASYRETNVPEAKSFCSDLRADFDRKKLRADHIFDQLTDLEREIDKLKDEARKAGLMAALSALGALGGYFGTMGRAYRRLKDYALERRQNRIYWLWRLLSAPLLRQS